VKTIYPQDLILFLAAVENRFIDIIHQSEGPPEFYLNTQINISCVVREYDNVEVIKVVYNDSIKVYTTGCVIISNGKWLVVDNLRGLTGIEFEDHNCKFLNTNQSIIFPVELKILDNQIKGSLSCSIYNKDMGEIFSSEIKISEVKGESFYK